MRQKTFWIAASCVLAMLGLRPIFSSGAAPTSAYRIIYSFTGGADGGDPMSDLTLDAAGNLYGTTSGGGTGACNSGCGTVFELKRTQDGWKEQVLYSFVGGRDGAGPEAGVILDKAGNLYGTTAGGGDNWGTVFRLAPDSHRGWTESILYTFTNGNDGANPQADLTFDAEGNLYGTTFAFDGYGSVFDLIRQANGSWAEKTIHTFTGAPDGTNPSSAVILDSVGSVYGMTEFGGTERCLYVEFRPGCGVVYKLTPTSDRNWTESVIYDFVRGGGSAVNPSAGLILDNVGHLFGTTLQGGDGLGTVFGLTQSQKVWQQNVLYRFNGNPDGRLPVGRVEMNAEGALFGATIQGGKNNFGTVFELKRSETNVWKERVLHSFGSAPDGSYPQAGIALDSRGHLYGTTSGGGGTACNNGCGTVYEITP
jgi:uncharacterized repeat protein (TIGR03803 family)